VEHEALGSVTEIVADAARRGLEGVPHRPILARPLALGSRRRPGFSVPSRAARQVRRGDDRH
jgi:hypothetical protein